MAVFKPGSPSKLTLEQDDFIYECVDPSVTLTLTGDCVTVEARCWNLTTRQKENMESESFVDEVREFEATEKKVKKKKKVKARNDRFPKDGGRPVNASVPGYMKIPWSQTTLSLIAQSSNGQLHYAKTMEEKKAFAWREFNWILVCWPGKYTQDIFLIDDMSAFRYALGFRKKSEAVVTDEKGEEWIYEFLFPPAKAKTPVVKSTSTPAYPTYAGYGKDGW